MIKQYNTIIIGAGQAGLSLGYYLRNKDNSFLLIDRQSRIGDSWRLRYDSLKLFTPRSHSALPGLKLPGKQNGYPTKDEIADYLEKYAQSFDLPVKLNTDVIKLEKQGNSFQVHIGEEEVLQAKNIVIATGPFKDPFIPNFSSQLSRNIYQVHSEYYENPRQLYDGQTLVVGGGNSGMQIATELAESRQVYLSLGKKAKFLPYEVLNKSIFWWFNVLGISRLTVHSTLGKILKKNDPIIGKEIKPLIKKGKVKILPRAIEVIDNKILFDNGFSMEPKNVIWATGFKPDYSWIKIEKIFDENGLPIHERGVTQQDGLYFLGLSWQYRRGSALLLGVGEDAKFLANKL